jgi:hypothetical protein
MFIASRRRDAKLLSGLAGAAALAAGSQAYAQGTAVPIATPADIPTPPTRQHRRGRTTTLRLDDEMQ